MHSRTQGPRGRLRQVPAEREARPGALYWGPWAECFGVPRLRSDWSVQTRKSSVLVSPEGSYLRDTHREGPGSGGEDFIPKAIGESSRERTFTYDSVGCSLGGGAKSRSRALQAAWTQNRHRGSNIISSLTKLSSIYCGIKHDHII